jgi:acyl carrier protein
MIDPATALQTCLARLLVGRMTHCHDDTPLFSTGLLDSFHLLDVIVFIESHLGRRLSPLEVHLDHIDTPRRILAYLAKHQPHAPQP